MFKSPSAKPHASKRKKITSVGDASTEAQELLQHNLNRSSKGSSLHDVTSGTTPELSDGTYLSETKWRETPGWQYNLGKTLLPERTSVTPNLPENSTYETQQLPRDWYTRLEKTLLLHSVVPQTVTTPTPDTGIVDDAQSSESPAVPIRRLVVKVNRIEDERFMAALRASGEYGGTPHPPPSVLQHTVSSSERSTEQPPRRLVKRKLRAGPLNDKFEQAFDGSPSDLETPVEEPRSQEISAHQEPLSKTSTIPKMPIFKSTSTVLRTSNNTLDSSDTTEMLVKNRRFIPEEKLASKKQFSNMFDSDSSKSDDENAVEGNSLTATHKRRNVVTKSASKKPEVIPNEASEKAKLTNEYSDTSQSGQPQLRLSKIRRKSPEHNSSIHKSVNTDMNRRDDTGTSPDTYEKPVKGRRFILAEKPVTKRFSDAFKHDSSKSSDKNILDGSLSARGETNDSITLIPEEAGTINQTRSEQLYEMEVSENSNTSQRDRPVSRISKIKRKLPKDDLFDDVLESGSEESAGVTAAVHAKEPPPDLNKSNNLIVPDTYNSSESLEKRNKQESVPSPSKRESLTTRLSTSKAQIANHPKSEMVNVLSGDFSTNRVDKSVSRSPEVKKKSLIDDLFEDVMQPDSDTSGTGVKQSIRQEQDLVTAADRREQSRTKSNPVETPSMIRPRSEVQHLSESSSTNTLTQTSLRIHKTKSKYPKDNLFDDVLGSDSSKSEGNLAVHPKQPHSDVGGETVLSDRQVNDLFDPELSSSAVLRKRNKENGALARNRGESIATKSNLVQGQLAIQPTGEMLNVSDQNHSENKLTKSISLISKPKRKSPKRDLFDDVLESGSEESAGGMEAVHAKESHPDQNKSNQLFVPDTYNSSESLEKRRKQESVPGPSKRESLTTRLSTSKAQIANHPKSDRVNILSGDINTNPVDKSVSRSSEVKKKSLIDDLFEDAMQPDSDTSGSGVMQSIRQEQDQVTVADGRERSRTKLNPVETPSVIRPRGKVQRLSESSSSNSLNQTASRIYKTNSKYPKHNVFDDVLGSDSNESEGSFEEHREEPHADVGRGTVVSDRQGNDLFDPDLSSSAVWRKGNKKRNRGESSATKSNPVQGQLTRQPASEILNVTNQNRSKTVNVSSENISTNQLVKRRTFEVKEKSFMDDIFEDALQTVSDTSGSGVMRSAKQEHDLVTAADRIEESKTKSDSIETQSNRQRGKVKHLSRSSIDPLSQTASKVYKTKRKHPTHNLSDDLLENESDESGGSLAVYPELPHPDVGEEAVSGRVRHDLFDSDRTSLTKLNMGTKQKLDLGTSKGESITTTSNLVQGQLVREPTSEMLNASNRNRSESRSAKPVSRIIKAKDTVVQHHLFEGTVQTDSGTSGSSKVVPDSVSASNKASVRQLRSRPHLGEINNESQGSHKAPRISHKAPTVKETVVTLEVTETQISNTPAKKNSDLEQNKKKLLSTLFEDVLDRDVLVEIQPENTDSQRDDSYSRKGITRQSNDISEPGVKTRGFVRNTRKPVLSKDSEGVRNVESESVDVLQPSDSSKQQAHRIPVLKGLAISEHMAGTAGFIKNSGLVSSQQLEDDVKSVSSRTESVQDSRSLRHKLPSGVRSEAHNVSQQSQEELLVRNRQPVLQLDEIEGTQVGVESKQRLLLSEGNRTVSLSRLEVSRHMTVKTGAEEIVSDHESNTSLSSKESDRLAGYGVTKNKSVQIGTKVKQTNLQHKGIFSSDSDDSVQVNKEQFARNYPGKQYINNEILANLRNAQGLTPKKMKIKQKFTSTPSNRSALKTLSTPDVSEISLNQTVSQNINMLKPSLEEHDTSVFSHIAQVIREEAPRMVAASTAIDSEIHTLKHNMKDSVENQMLVQMPNLPENKSSSSASHTASVQKKNSGEALSPNQQHILSEVSQQTYGKQGTMKGGEKNRISLEKNITVKNVSRIDSTTVNVSEASPKADRSSSSRLTKRDIVAGGSSSKILQRDRQVQLDSGPAVYVERVDEEREENTGTAEQGSKTKPKLVPLHRNKGVGRGNVSRSSNFSEERARLPEDVLQEEEFEIVTDKLVRISAVTEKEKHVTMGRSLLVTSPTPEGIQVLQEEAGGMISSKHVQPPIETSDSRIQKLESDSLRRRQIIKAVIEAAEKSADEGAVPAGTRTIYDYFPKVSKKNLLSPKKQLVKKSPVQGNSAVVDLAKYYRKPRLTKPAPWVTRRLYDKIIRCCESKFGYLKSRVKAEEFVTLLASRVKRVIRLKKKYEHFLKDIMKMLFTVGLIKTTHDFYLFIEDYLPDDFRFKSIPSVRAFGQQSGPHFDPNLNVHEKLKFKKQADFH